LVFGGEVVLPLEVELPSLRIAIRDQITEDQQAKLRLHELESLEGNRIAAQRNLEAYRQPMSRSYDKLVKHRTSKKGELVLALR
jgi:hypothetical protein